VTRKSLFKIAIIAVTLKILIVLAVLCALFFNGLSQMQELWLGVEVMPLNNTMRNQFGVTKRGGVLVNAVLPHSPAEHAGRS